MRHLILATPLLALTLAGTASSQNAGASADSLRPFSPVKRGARVRLTLTGDTTSIVGRVVRLDPNEMMVAPEDSGSAPRLIRFGRVTQLEVEQDEKLRTVSAQVGGILGAVAAAGYYYFGWCRRDEHVCERSQQVANACACYDQPYLDAGTVFAIGGLLVGGLVGYFLAPAPHWELVASPVVRRDERGDAHRLLRLGVALRLHRH